NLDFSLNAGICDSYSNKFNNMQSLLACDVLIVASSDVHPEDVNIDSKYLILGEIILYAGVYTEGSFGGNVIPCDGSQQDISTFPELASLYGDMYGEQAGEDTFSIPDCRKR